MKLATQTNEFHSGGNVAQTNYRVANSPHMMEILSSKIYSNKIAAVIRELSTNAFESHMRANNDNPYHVNFPSYKNPTFTIRDFGTGLSEEDIQTLYTTYGASDKGDSNIFTGCLGLGSKAPFAYTDTFTTISYFNGKKISVLNTKDKSGIPSCIVMEITNTTEPNGLEVYFEVKPEDIGRFSTEAINIYRFFEEKYRPHTNIPLSYPKFTEQYKVANWIVTGNTNSYVVMGQIGYPLNKDKVDQKYNKLIINGVILNFAIGEVSMSASRENLEYNDFTIKALNDRLEIVYGELKTLIEKEIDSCKNNFEAACTIDSNRVRYSNLGIKPEDLLWNGNKIIFSCPVLMGETRKMWSNYGTLNQEMFPTTIHFTKNTHIYYEDKIGARLRK